MSFLSDIGADIKKVFGWLGSAKGQTVIKTGEAIVEAIYPAADGALTLANGWLTEIIKAESMAAAAGQQTGSGVQKAAIVINTMTPEVLAFAAANKLPIPDATQIQKASDSLVAFLNVLGAPPAAPAPVS
jgi:hypothetical protein